MASVAKQNEKDSWQHTIIVASILLIFGTLSLSKLGHYALWDDEALTALTGEGVWRTGDTTAIVGHNLLAYREGLLIRHLHDRSTSPLQFYVVAPFIGLMGRSALAARLPFALIGISGIALMLWWVKGTGASRLKLITWGLATIGNASLILFLRQARYYPLAMALAIAVAYLYFHLKHRRNVVLLSIALTLLLASHYLTFGSVALMLAVDYIIWRRRERPLLSTELAIILIPPMVVGTVLLNIWDPFHIKTDTHPPSWLVDRATLFWWGIRDINACEFGAVTLLVLAPFVGWWFNARWLCRASLALFVGLLVEAILSPGNTVDSPWADVRYLAWLIPLCISICAGTVWTISRERAWICLPLAVLAFGSNLFHLGFLPPSGIHSTICKYVRELGNPSDNVYAIVSDWINSNVKNDESIFAIEDFTAYPLMFAAPKAIYGWQLSPEQKADPDYQDEPNIQFKGMAMPDYIISFGPYWHEFQGRLPVKYRLVKRFAVFGREMYRPELFWRSFGPVRQFDANTDAIYIFKKDSPAQDEHESPVSQFEL